MGDKFLGLGGMSREDQLRVGLIAIFVLALECVLEGLVVGASLRGWIFHAVAAVTSIWALYEFSSLAVRLASTAGVVAVGNEALLISEANASMHYLMPAMVLFVVSGWVFQRSIASVVHIERDSWTGSDPVSSATMLDFEMSPQPLPSNQLRKLTPFIIGGGSLLVLYGIFLAPWVETRALFGLLSDELNLSQVSSKWIELGAGEGVTEFIASGIQTFSFVGLMIAIFGAVASHSQQLVVSRQIHLSCAAAIILVSILQFVVIAELVSVESDLRVLAGAWTTPVGTLLAGIGFWLTAD